MSAPDDRAIPETHEHIREEDIAETLDVFREGNAVLPKLNDEQLEWLAGKLEERRELCAREYGVDGVVDGESKDRLRAIDAEINELAPEILKVLHFLSRVRAIIPSLKTLQEEMKAETSDPTQRMVLQMKFDCSKAEVQSAVEGLTGLLVRPRIFDEM